MKDACCKVANIRALEKAFGDAANRPLDLPGMVLVDGVPGSGKTYGTAYLASGHNAVYMRADDVWSAGAMLMELRRALGGYPVRTTNAEHLRWVKDHLTATPRPIIVDEVEGIAGNRALMESLRSIHDVTGVPIVLVGHTGIAAKLDHYPQLTRRLVQHVTMGALTLDDTHVVVTKRCEVGVADDLLALLHKATQGNVGLVATGILRIEAFARSKGLELVDLEAWGGRELFTGKAPRW